MPLRRGYERAGVGGLVLLDFEPPEETDFSPGYVRRAYVFAHAFEILFALLAIVSAVSSFIDPASLAKSAVGEALHPLDWVWNGAYLGAAIGVVYGLLKPEPRVEASALLVLAGAVLANAIAVVGLRGVSGAASTATLLAAGVVFVIRAWIVYTALRELHAAVALSHRRRRDGTEQRRNA